MNIPHSNLSFKTHLLLGMLLICISAYSQVAKGKVVDDTNGEPIPFATIYATPDISKSTTTNVNGEFSLEEVMSQDSIRISYVGYETQTLKCSPDWRNGQTIRLKSLAYELPQVIISNINLKNLVKNIRKKWRHNYPSRYPILEGTYRKQEIEDNELVTLAQCRMALLTPPAAQIKDGEKPMANINGRIMLDPIETTGRKQLGVFLYIEPMLYPFFMELNPETYDNYQWFIEQITPEADGDEIYKIRYQSSIRQHKGYFYVSKRDNAILSIHMERPSKGLPNRNPDIAFHSTHYIWDIFYRKIDGKYQYSYMRTEFITQYSNRLTENESEYRIIVDYLVDKRIPIKKNTTNFNAYLRDPFRDKKAIPMKLITSFTKILPDYE